MNIAASAASQNRKIGRKPMPYSMAEMKRDVERGCAYLWGNRPARCNPNYRAPHRPDHFDDHHDLPAAHA